LLQYHRSNIRQEEPHVYSESFGETSLLYSSQSTRTSKPAEENCSEGIFLEISSKLNQEQKDMIQWHQYVPERAAAAYLVPFEDIDLTREDYAIIWIQALRSKSRTKHPCFVPKDFAIKVINRAKQPIGNVHFQITQANGRS
jgi:hypothetical protein